MPAAYFQDYSRIRNSDQKKYLVFYGWKRDNSDDIISDDVFLFQFIQLCVYDMTFLTSLQFSSPFSSLLKVRKFQKPMVYLHIFQKMNEILPKFWPKQLRSKFGNIFFGLWRLDNLLSKFPDLYRWHSVFWEKWDCTLL